METLVMLANATPRGLDPEIVKPGWIALGIVVALCVAVALLARSFSKHTRRANQPWEGEEVASQDDVPADDRSTSTAGHDDAR